MVQLGRTFSVVLQIGQSDIGHLVPGWILSEESIEATARTLRMSTLLTESPIGVVRVAVVGVDLRHRNRYPGVAPTTPHAGRPVHRARRP
ncbi:hypothetical protein C449_05337 [Halococcus saccharolyticus DSM 5350]|uniref:Uncharacterized protein n=1 Tax=Halococcus saccharolyticus DSM 5350 TaxID=1227455 RepID=M0MK94_9EURY|nr:hypothetical protein C449_05337 [Halococcus saccharolyticus DSM 5350]